MRTTTLMADEMIFPYTTLFRSRDEEAFFIASVASVASCRTSPNRVGLWGPPVNRQLPVTSYKLQVSGRPSGTNVATSAVQTSEMKAHRSKRRNRRDKEEFLIDS